MSTVSLEKAAAWRHRHHIEMLVFSILIIIASLVLHVGDEGKVQIGPNPSFHLPPLCLSRAIFGVECPGCGLTRGFVLLAHGHWYDSLAMNRVGWFVALALLIQIPYRVLAIRRHESLPLGKWPPTLLAWAVIAALIGNWLLKQCGI